MKLLQIVAGQWKVLAVKTDRGDCPLLEFLTGLDKSLSTHSDSMLSLLEEVSEKHELPQQWIPSRKCHTITQDGKIWQFTVGSLRVAWFFDDGRIIVCTHGYFKDSNETKKKDKNEAIAARNNYLAAKKNKQLQIEVE